MRSNPGYNTMNSEIKISDFRLFNFSVAARGLFNRFCGRSSAGVNSVCILLLLMLSPLVHAASIHKHSPSPLQVVMAPADKTDHLSITVTNRSDQPVTFLGWDTPFEPDILADVFDISVPKKGFLPVNRVTYTGPLPRRGVPDESAWITLASGEELTRVINVAEFYPLAKAANVRISYKQDLVLEHRNAKKARIPFQSARSAGAVQSAALELFVPQAETEVRASSVQMNLSAAPQQARALPANFNSCSASQEAAIDSAFRESELVTDTVLAEMSALSAEDLSESSRYQAWFGEFSVRRSLTVSGILARMADAYDQERMTFDCQCVLTNRNSLFGFIRRDQPFRVNICPLFFSLEEERVITIVHELTHFNEVGPTDDFAYGPGPSRQLAATNPEAAVINAESYGYFVVNNSPALPLIGSADGALADNPSFEFESLDIVSTSSGQLQEGALDLFVVSGVTSINLESVSGDADLFVFFDDGLSQLQCSSESASSPDNCQINNPGALYIAVVGFSDSSYVLTTDGPLPDQSVTSLTPEQSVTASIARSDSDFYTITGVRSIVLDSLSGDVDLYVYGSADFDWQSLVCESLRDSSNSSQDVCQVPEESTFYLRVFGFADSDYSLLASQGTLDSAVGDLNIVSLDNGETISALVAEGDVELYTATGPGRLDLLSQSGDADPVSYTHLTLPTTPYV